MGLVLVFARELGLQGRRPLINGRRLLSYN